MKTIRMGVFETNSSSTHSLCILTKQEYQDWQDDKVVLNLYNGRVEPLNPKIPAIIDKGYCISFGDEEYESIRDLYDEGTEIFDDGYATADYIDLFAEVEQKELDDKVIMSIYRGDRW